jgi:Cytochrome c554 and c-prime
MRNKKSFIFFVVTAGAIFFLSRCNTTIERKADPRGNVYIGSESCRQCHKAVYDAYVTTAHYKTTQTSSDKNVQGSFHSGSNTFDYGNQSKLVMEQRDSGLFQVFYVNGKEAEAHRFDLTFGTKHAQTFLYWQGNKSFELPVSYYSSENAWAASPGFSSTQVNFGRFVGKNCFECHSSFIDSKLNSSPDGIEEVLDRSSLIVGIDCERCHGPALNHVNYHLAYPDEKEAKYMVHVHSLTRQQKLDACAVCHSGNDKEKEISSFRFRMGDTLASLFLPWAAQRNKGAEPDVHGNQYGLLAQSQCFIKSKTLDCSTCHSAHTDASNDLQTYSQKCISCHATTNHSSLKLDATTASTINNNCIDCHMPQQPSRLISFQLAGSSTKAAYFLRTHKIAIYPKENHQ